MTGSWARARVLEASDRSYRAVVLPLLDGAQKEIVASLYVVEPNDTASPDHPVNRFLEALLRARGRGVRVRIYLNTRFRLRTKTEVASGKYFQRLLEAGVEVTTLLPNRRLHDKLIVIDGRYVVEGSTNWSASALQDNYESASVIDSPEHARKKLLRIDQLTLPAPQIREIDRPLLAVPETVKIPLALFEKDGLPRMIAASDQRAMDFYLALLGQARAGGKEEFEVDLETLGRALRVLSKASSNAAQRFERSTIRRQMIKVLRKLATRYELIEAEFPFGRDARVRLKEFPGEEVGVPGRVLEADYLREAGSGAAFLELARAVLNKEGVDIDSVSAAQLERRFGVGQSTLLHARSGK